MTREEHIAKAEELLREYRDTESGINYGTWHPTAHELAVAQVHATLAVAVATGDLHATQAEALLRRRWRSAAGQ